MISTGYCAVGHAIDHRCPRACLLACLALVVLLSAIPTVQADSAYRITGRWLAADGLPVDSPSALAMDGSGRLWVASHDGLAVFTGAEFQLFNTTSTPSLPDNRLMNLHAWDASRVIVQTESGELGLFSERSGYQRIGRSTIAGLMIVNDSVWFIEDQRLIRWHQADGRSVIVDSDATALSGDRERVLLGTTSGDVLAINPSTHEVSHHSKTGHHPIHALALSANGSTAFLTAHHLGIIDAGQAEPRGNLPHPLNNRMYPRARIASTGDRWLLANVAQRNQDHFWLYDPKTDALTRLPLESFAPAGISHQDDQGRQWTNLGTRLLLNDKVIFESEYLIRDFLPDRYGQIWLATLRDGLIRLAKPPVQTHGTDPDQRAQQLDSYHIQRDGEQLLVGGFTNLERFDPRNNQWETIHNEPSLSTLQLDDHWLIGGKRLCKRRPGGLCQFDPRFDHSETWISLLHRDAEDTIWLGDASGLYWRDKGQVSWTHLTSDIQPISVLALEQRRLWFGTERNGIYQADLNSRPPQVTPLLDESAGLASNNVRSFLRTRSGEILIGTADNGLCLYQTDRQQLIGCLSTPQGLPTHSVHCLLRDDHDRIWANTNQGLWSTPETHLLSLINNPQQATRFRRYTRQDGLVSEEGNGGVGSPCLRTDDGSLWFASQKGIVQVRPDLPEDKNWPVRVTLRPHDHAPGQPVSLPVDARSLRVTLAPIALRGGPDVHFRYRLGDDQNWTSIGRQNEVTFRSLPAGRYPLQVQARYSDSSWRGPIARLDINAPPRLAERTGFWAGLASAALVLFSMLLLREHRRSRELERRVNDRTRNLRSALSEVERQAHDLQEASAEKRQLFMTIGHELRTPLTLILGPLGDHQNGPSATQRKRMRQAAEQMRELIDQILMLERDDSASRLNRQAEPLASLLATTIERMRPSLEEARMRWQVSVEQSLRNNDWRVDVEARRFDLAIATLIGNAIKYAGPHGHLHIEARPEHDHREVSLTVDDDGPGIPIEQRQRLLQPFAIGPHSNTGLGLGLGLCQQIIQQFDGTVSIEDSPLGGTRVRIALPLHHQPPASAPASPRRDAPLVLVVDDNAGIRAHLSELLSPHYQVIEAADGSRGLTLAVSELPDLIITDISMPVENGLAMIEQLRRNPETAIIPAIFITAHASPENEHAAFRAGGDQYLPKPFTDEQLRNRVARLLSARREIIEQLHALASADTSNEMDEPTENTFQRQLSQVIDEHLDEPQFDVEALARALNMSRSSLYRRLQQRFSMTPAEYIRKHRLERAAQLLDQGNHRVSEIAYALGFKRLSTFTRSFRTQFGHAPSAWRNRQKDTHTSGATTSPCDL